MRDVVVLAEFNELTGPRPVVCWPRRRFWRNRMDGAHAAADRSDGCEGEAAATMKKRGHKRSGSTSSTASGTSGKVTPAVSERNDEAIDLDAFILRIMSVDLNAAAMIGEQNRFRVSEDSQVILSESDPKVFAFVHYFVLHDLSARGFVRPFCFAYITEDEEKLLKYFSALSTDFSKTCKLLKYGNHFYFTRDLKFREADLIHTQKILNEMADSQGGVAEDQTQTGKMSVQQALEEVRIVQREIGLRSWDEDFKHKWDPLLRTQQIQERRDRSFTMSSRPTSNPIPMPGQVNRSRSNSVTENAASDEKGTSLASSYKPKYTTVLKLKTFNTELKDVRELCGGMYEAALKRIQTALKRFSMKHNELLLSAEESKAVDFPSSLLLTMGRCTLLSFQLPITKNTRTGRQLMREQPQKLADRILSTPSAISGDYFHGGSGRDRSQSISAQSMQSIYIDATEELRNAPSVVGLSENLEAANMLFALKAKRKQKLQNSSEHVALESEHKPGYGLQWLKSHCSYLPHLVFALARGRPVIILAEPEMEMKVRALITALWLFVPGHSDCEKVIRWRDARPFEIQELAQVKLIGMSKRMKHELPKALERCASWLDFESGVLLSPEYRGALITRMLRSCRDAMNETVLLAIIHVELLNWASIAYQYFHMHCMDNNMQDDGPAVDMSCYKWANNQHAARIAFLNDQGIKDDDISIIIYLAEVVKRQQVAEYHNYRGGQSCGEPTIKMDFAKVQKFTNYKPPLSQS